MSPGGGPAAHPGPAEGDLAVTKGDALTEAGPADATAPGGEVSVPEQRPHSSDVQLSGRGRVHSAQRFFLRLASTLSPPHCSPPAPMSRSSHRLATTGLDLGAS